MTISNLPRALRISQCIEHGPDGFEKLTRFIVNALDLENNEINRPLFHNRDSQINTLAGSWKGSWRRFNGRIWHNGHLSLHQDGNTLEATLIITFRKRETISIIEEHLEGSIAGSTIILRGISYSYIEQGLSSSYLLDNFILNLDEAGKELNGQFYSKKGTGEVNFIKQ
jgi:hypothetical protein